MGQEKVPGGFGLRTGDPSNTADGSGNCRRPDSQAQITGKNWGLPEPLLFLFLRYGTLDWANGRRKDCVCLWMF